MLRFCICPTDDEVAEGERLVPPAVVHALTVCANPIPFEYLSESGGSKLAVFIECACFFDMMLHLVRSGGLGWALRGKKAPMTFVARTTGPSLPIWVGCGAGLAAIVALQEPPSLCSMGDYEMRGKPTTKLMLELRRKTSFNNVELARLWNEFKTIDDGGSKEAGTQSDGRISYDEFEKFFSGRLNLDHAHMISLFRCFDTDGNHEIDFEEFAVGASVRTG